MLHMMKDGLAGQLDKREIKKETTCDGHVRILT